MRRSQDAPSLSLRCSARAALDGCDTLGDAELLAVLLEKGKTSRSTLRLAAELLDDSGGLSGLARRGLGSLADVPGVGEARATTLTVAFELGRRLAREHAAEPRPLLDLSSKVAAYMAPRLAHLEHEQLWALALDGRNRLRAARRVAEGGLHGCSTRAPDVLRAMLREAASAFVLVHNHPGGSSSPSAEDVAFTQAVGRAGAEVGTPLVDHVIIAGTSWSSFFDLGLLPAEPGDPRARG